MTSLASALALDPHLLDLPCCVLAADLGSQGRGREGRQNCPHFRILQFVVLADSLCCTGVFKSICSNFQAPLADQFTDDSSLVCLGFPHPLNFCVLPCSGMVKC